MNYSIRRFALDLHKAQSQISIAAFRNDTAVKLSILITDGGSPYRFEEGVIAVLWGTKEDGKPISHSCSIEESTRIIYEFNDTTTDDVGVIDCQIRFYKGGEQILSAPKFSIVVSERIGNDDEIESYEYEDEEYGKYFAQQFSSLDEIFTKESARVTAEEARDFAEKARDTAEKARVEAEIKREEGYAQVDAKIEGKLEGKLDKINQSWILYGNGANNAPTYYWVSEQKYPNAVVKRDAKQDVLVPDMPSSKGAATSKKYVDDKHIAIEERVSDLESLTLSYPEIASTDYEKAVPAEVGKPALIKKIGGATEKVASSNRLNPYTVQLHPKGGPDETDLVSFTVSGDGDIVFELTESMPVFGVRILFGAENFAPAKYGMYIENMESGDYRDAHIYTEILNDMPEHTCFMVDKPEGEQYENWYPDYYKFTIRLMVYKIEDSDTLEFVDMTESISGDAYEPYGFRFKHAEVSKVESLGANLIPYPYVYKGKPMNVGYKETISGVTFEILENGLVRAIGTATATATFRFWQAEMPAGNYYVSGEYSSGGIVIGSYNGLTNGCGQINTEFVHNGGLFGAGVRVESGVTVNSIFYPIITKNVYVSEFKPYKSEPIDTFAIPVEAIKSRVDGYGLDKNYIQCIDNKFEFVQKRKRAILNSKVGCWSAYPSLTSSGAYVYRITFEKKKIGYQTSICSAFENKNTSFGDGVYGQYSDHPDLSTVYFCSDKATLNEWTAWLDEKEASGNPVILEYDLATPVVTDITDLFTKNKLQVEGGGTLRFVNENKTAVPNTVGFVARKG